MTVIDSQVHAYEANTPTRQWHSVPNWPDHVTGDEMVAAMDTVGGDGAIFISAFSLYQYDASYPDIWEPLARVFDAWGFDRCLWGTDWTRAFAVVNYEQAVEPFRLTDRLSDSERAMLMGGACAKAYRWSPKKG